MRYNDFHWVAGWVNWLVILFCLGKKSRSIWLERKEERTLNHFDPLESVVSHIVRMSDETAAGDSGRSDVFIITGSVNGGVGVFRLGRRRRRYHHQRRFVMVRITTVVISRSVANNNRVKLNRITILREKIKMETFFVVFRLLSFSPAARWWTIDVTPIGYAASTQKVRSSTTASGAAGWCGRANQRRMARPHSRLTSATVDPVMKAHHLLLLQLNGPHKRSLHFSIIIITEYSLVKKTSQRSKTIIRFFFIFSRRDTNNFLKSFSVFFILWPSQKVRWNYRARSRLNRTHTKSGFPFFNTAPYNHFIPTRTAY